MELNYKKFVEIIRHDHPKTPIVLMTRIRFADVMTTWGEMISDTDANYEKLLEPLYETYREFKKKGDEEIFIFKADKVIPRAKNPPLVDGIHPDDRGFADLTRALEPFLRKILKSPTF
jgi:lysophospholipase L1-like esterase